MPAVFAPVTSDVAITELPAWVYTDLADPDVSQIDVPFGRYTITGQQNITRGGFTIDFHNSSLYLAGTLNGYHFWIASTVNPYDSGSSRTYSHLTGQIYEATTQLTMHVDEPWPPSAGEWVQIMAGVNWSDPQEPARYFIRQVESVVGSVITFTEPFGSDIVVYADEAALQAVVTPSQWGKIGPWGVWIPATTSYGKGLGLDHGLIRFTGDLLRDITFKNFYMETIIPVDASLPPAVGTAFFTRDIVNFTLENVTVCNSIKAFAHTWRTDNVLIDGLNWIGIGRYVIAAASPPATWPSQLIAAWGGTGLTYRNFTVSGENLTLANMEASPADVLFQNIDMTVRYRKNFAYASQAALLGFYGLIYPEGSGAVLEDCTFSIRADVFSTWHFDGNNDQFFTNPVFDELADFPQYFVFTRYTITGTLTFGAVTYGALTSRTDTVIRTATANAKHITPPKGFYKSFQFRVLAAGACTAIRDVFGNNYDAALGTGAWTAVNTGWLQVSPNTPLATYQSDRRLVFYWTPVGGTSCTVEFDIDYYPAPDDVGWTMD